MADTLGWFLVTLFVGTSAYFLIAHKGKSDLVLDRLHISRRRVSGAKTPPRSLSPSKKQVQGLADVTYVDTLPPSRRSALTELDASTSKVFKDQKDLAASDCSNNMAPMKTSYLKVEDTLYTPCGFTIKDVKQLGDFPDYATLSGVPLPCPYPEFDIQKAIPRPYRPFRWAYHQTMCG